MQSLLDCCDGILKMVELLALVNLMILNCGLQEIIFRQSLRKTREIIIQQFIVVADTGTRFEKCQVLADAMLHLLSKFR